MSAIMIVCPDTGLEVPVGIETDEASFQNIPQTVSTTSCPACGKAHEWSVGQAWLATPNDTPEPA